MKKINLYKNLYKNSDEFDTDITKFNNLFAILHIKEDVILFTSSTGENVSAYDIRKHYQENIYNRTEPKSMVYHENIHADGGFTYANYVEVLGCTHGWDVEMLMVEVFKDESTEYMILVF